MTASRMLKFSVRHVFLSPGTPADGLSGPRASCLDAREPERAPRRVRPVDPRPRPGAWGWAAGAWGSAPTCSIARRPASGTSCRASVPDSVFRYLPRRSRAGPLRGRPGRSALRPVVRQGGVSPSNHCVGRLTRWGCRRGACLAHRCHHFAGRGSRRRRQGRSGGTGSCRRN